MTSTKAFLFGAVTLAVGVFVGVLLSDGGAPRVQTLPDLAPHVDTLTRAIEGFARQRPAPLRASSPSGAVPGADPAPSDAPSDPRPLDVGPSRDELAAQVAALSARVAYLEARGGGLSPTLRPLGADGDPVARIPMQVDAVEAVIDSDDGTRSDEFLFLGRRQLYERLGTPSSIQQMDSGLTWQYTPGGDTRRNRWVIFTFHDGLVIRILARR